MTKKIRQISLEVPIKINLSLHVLDQQANGHHSLQTLVTFAYPGDRISVTASAQDEVEIDGDYGGDLSAGSDNLIIKARDVLRAAIGKTFFPIKLKLTKNLPLASGLGGGSADSAATLLALAQLWQIEPAENILYDLACQIGADVPMCLHALQHNQALLATGIGDNLISLPQFAKLNMVIINPNKPLSTAAVFGHLTKKNNPPFQLVPELLTATDRLIPALKAMRNDLTPPACALMPEISQIIQMLEHSGAMLARMSGSGASCFGLYDSLYQAQTAAILLKRQHPDYFVKAVHNSQHV